MQLDMKDSPPAAMGSKHDFDMVCVRFFCPTGRRIHHQQRAFLPRAEAPPLAAPATPAPGLTPAPRTPAPTAERAEAEVKEVEVKEAKLGAKGEARRKTSNIQHCCNTL